MEKIAITGGKGGTGKSTVAFLLANELADKGSKVFLVDCDVECPNAYLLAGQKLKTPKHRVFADFPKLIPEKCAKCGLCVKSCQNNAIFRAPDKYPVFIKDLCSACGACQIVCPYGAISFQKQEIGKIFVNKIKDCFWLITGLAKSGLEETGPVVRAVKDFALNLAKKEKTDKVLLDTAAGMHCPVISALLGCDLALAVTEPTPMGSHDLALILDLLKKIKVPGKIIINQANLGPKAEIEKIAKRFKTKIIKEIPYSKKIVNAYSKGKLTGLKGLKLKLI